MKEIFKEIEMSGTMTDPQHTALETIRHALIAMRSAQMAALLAVENPGSGLRAGAARQNVNALAGLLDKLHGQFDYIDQSFDLLVKMIEIQD